MLDDETTFPFCSRCDCRILNGGFAQLPTTKVLTMDVADIIARGALTQCRTDGYKVTVLVVDGLNSPKAMLRDDGAAASTAEVAKMKATATMLYNRPSGPAAPPPAGQTAPPATIPGTINAQGGVPIKWAKRLSALLPSAVLRAAIRMPPAPTRGLPKLQTN